ncbi:DUF5324 family protein [Kitasatospora sp. NPDC048365]|uniref:DUF5324 family protein n=1 Tax=Kitasatospora sp. NPDC048365 TaxID=3364050 RepID=UPI00372173F0
MDTARETAGRTKDAIAPYAATAKDAALHYADEAKHLIGPKLEALGPKAAAAGAQARTGASNAAQAARVQYVKHVAPRLESAFTSLPPETQKATLKAVHRAQEAALAAKLSATQAAGQARSTVVPKVTDAYNGAVESVTPYAQEAQARGAAALTALQGHVSAAEISELAAKNIKKENHHRSGWATGLAVAGTIAIGTGVLAWQWYRKQNNPEWLVEPPVPAAGSGSGGLNGGGSGTQASAVSDSPAGSATGAPVGDAVMNGSAPRPTAEEDPKDSPAPKPGPSKPTAPAPDDRPKPHDPRKPH